MQHSYRTHELNKAVDNHDTSMSTSHCRMYSQKFRGDRNAGSCEGIKSLEQSIKDDDQNLSPSKLRAKLRAELEQRAKSCLHTGYKCTRPPATPTSDYCALHILQATGGGDPALIHYTRCAYVYSLNGRRCPNAAPKKRTFQGSLGPATSSRLPNQLHNQSYCFEHSRLAQRTRTRQASKRRAPKGLDSTLSGLSHYIVKSSNQDSALSLNKEKLINSNDIHSLHWSTGIREREKDIERNKIQVKLDENGKIVPLDPITEINPEQVEKSRHPIQYASSTDSEDEDAILYGDVDQGVGFLGSDDECLDDFTGFDPLKHAGIYTATEANMILRDKLSRLQELYVDQFKILQQELKIKKMKLAPALKREHETLCSVTNQPKDTVKEFNLYRKLKAYKRYNKKSGIEAILHDRSLERMAKYLDSNSKLSFNRPYSSHHSTQATGPKCIFSEGGIKCTDRPMPCAKFCRKHILQDKRQILFKPCAVEIGGVCCKEPITGILEIDTCPLHFKIPEPRTYNIRKEDSDSENFEDDQDEQDISTQRRLSPELSSSFQESSTTNKYDNNDMEFSIFENDRRHDRSSSVENDTFMSAGSDKIAQKHDQSTEDFDDSINNSNIYGKNDLHASHFSANDIKDDINEEINCSTNEIKASNEKLIDEVSEQSLLDNNVIDDDLKIKDEQCDDAKSMCDELNAETKSDSVIIEPLSDDLELENT